MTRTIAVIGGGASGMMAAITAARQGAAVTIYESKERLGKKLLATGNGKCNYTNLHQAPECYRGTHPEFALGILQMFSAKETISFFQSIGIMPKIKNGYVYPNSGQAVSVADALSLKVKELHITVKQETIVDIHQTRHSYLVTAKNESKNYDRIILCCGSPAGLPEGTEFFGYSIAETLGLVLIQPRPALVQLRCAEKWLKTVSGVRTEGTVTLWAEGTCIATEKGELLFTEYGLSGIPILQISRFAGEALAQQQTVTCKLDLLPELPAEEVLKQLWQRMEHAGERSAEESLIGLLHHKLNYVLLKENGILPTAPAKLALAEKKKRAALAAACKGLVCTVLSTNPLSNAQVCAGGISTKELNPKTLEAKKLPGLYVAGELIDIDGTCGGYNLQWAWSSGYIAGFSAAVDV